MNKTLALLLFAASFFYACQPSEFQSKKIKEIQARDSLKKANRLKDSLSLINITVKNKITLGTFTLKIIKPLSLKKRVIFENESSYYRYQEAQRFESMLTMRFILKSNDKPKDYKTFFPELNIFQIDKNNNTKYVGSLSFNTYNKTKRQITFLEQIYDYDEQETFVGWNPIKVPFAGKILVSVNESGNHNINFDTIIGQISYNK